MFSTYFPKSPFFCLSFRYVVVKWERSCLDYSSFAYPVLDLDSRARFVETTRYSFGYPEEGLLRFFLTIGSGLAGQILNFPLECSTTSWQGSFVVVNSSVLPCLSRRFLNELTLGAVTTLDHSIIW